MNNISCKVITSILARILGPSQMEAVGPSMSPRQAKGQPPMPPLTGQGLVELQPLAGDTGIGSVSTRATEESSHGRACSCMIAPKSLWPIELLM